jgi:hypothetical protein
LEEKLKKRLVNGQRLEYAKLPGLKPCFSFWFDVAAEAATHKSIFQLASRLPSIP